MKLNLKDIDDFIKKNNILEVKNAKMPTKKGFFPESLWSEEIFGRISSKERKTRFGYIDLGTNVIHPEAHRLVKSTSANVSKIIDKKANFKIDEEGVLKSDPDGETGLSFLIENFDKIDFEKNAKKEKKKEAKFIEKNKDKILIDKFLVIPAHYRDINPQKQDSVKISSEINEHYSSLIYFSNQAAGNANEKIIEKIQQKLLQTNEWIKNNLKGKGGVFRGTMLKKRLDYSTRLVLTSSPSMPLGKVGIPWSTLIMLYEPLFIHYVNKKSTDLFDMIEQEWMAGKDEELDNNELVNFIKAVNKDPESTSQKLKDRIKSALEEVLEDAVVGCKRDPVESRLAWFAAEPVVIEGRIVQVNSENLGPIGGDCDGDALQIVPLFSEEAKQEAQEKMNPSKSKTQWQDPTSLKNKIYSIDLDAIANIFKATKEP